MRSLFALILALAFTGCATSVPPPPVTPAMQKVSNGVSMTTLNHGREIFLGPCTRCHSTDAVNQFSAAEWQQAVDKMAHRAKLDPAEQAALLAYLTAARAVSNSRQ